ncbi:MAG: hypothetical protein K2G04_03840, partial [Oscillospiraceae bacterium]|nr:hypothetical protein [Oscillospiraceae bacterium]
MKKILCTLFAAAVIATTSAVTTFAEDNLIFIKTASTPKEVTEFAENIFKESESRLIGVGLTETEAKSAILGNSFIINDDDKPDNKEYYQFPILCGGKPIACLGISPIESIGYHYSISKSNIMENLGSLTTSPVAPAEIYFSGDFVFAAVNDELILLDSPNPCKKDKMEKAMSIIKNIRSGEDNLEKECVINVYGYSKTGWITVGKNTFYIKKNGTLATENTIIGGVFYRFGEDGKYLGTYTGFARSGDKRCYYQSGVKLTGDFTVNGKSYRADKNGNILTDEKPVYVKTAPVPKKADDYAKEVFAHTATYDLTSIGLTKSEAQSAKLGSAFVITSLSSDGKHVDVVECYYYPVVCGGDVKAFLTVHKTDGKFGWQLGVNGIEEKFNSLDTSYNDPAEIYYVDNI